jgi:hypothetical protein
MAEAYLAVIASEAKQSILSLRLHGLLRFARNDDLKSTLHLGRLKSVAPYSKGGSAAAQPPFRASMIRFANRVFPFKIEPPTRTSGGNECAALCSPANADLN